MSAAIDWEWKESAVVPAYYERALAPLKELPTQGDRILEVGVGCGYVLSKLALIYKTRGCGVDDDPGALELSSRIARRFGATIDLVRASGVQLPFREGEFDLVYSQGLIEHFPPDVTSALLDEHVRVLAPGGVLAMSVPNLFNPFHTWLKWREGPSYRFHPERSYSPRAVLQLLQSRGVQPLGRDGYGLFWSLWNGRSRLSYYLTAATLRMGLNHEFEARLPARLRWLLCMMTFVWGRKGGQRNA